MINHTLISPWLLVNIPMFSPVQVVQVTGPQQQRQGMDICARHLAVQRQRCEWRDEKHRVELEVLKDN